MLCSEVMKRQISSATIDTTVAQAAKVMRNERIGFLPICDPEGHPTGVVTDRDLTLRVCAESLPADTTALVQVMTKDPVRCAATATLDDAEALMLKRKTRRILVVDEQDKLVGLITLADMVHYLDPFKITRWIRELSAMRFRLEK